MIEIWWCWVDTETVAMGCRLLGVGWGGVHYLGGRERWGNDVRICV